MELANKYRMLIWVSVLLLIINLVTLATIWFKPPIPPSVMHPKIENRKKMNKGYLINELNLDSAQVELYHNSRKIHFKEVRKLKQEISRTKQLIHEEIFTETPDTVKINRWVDSIGVLNIQFERSNYRHFIYLKDQLNEEQMERFKQLMKESIEEPDQKRYHEHRKNRNQSE